MGTSPPSALTSCLTTVRQAFAEHPPDAGDGLPRTPFIAPSIYKNLSDGTMEPSLAFSFIIFYGEAKVKIMRCCLKRQQPNGGQQRSSASDHKRILLFWPGTEPSAMQRWRMDGTRGANKVGQCLSAANSKSPIAVLPAISSDLALKTIEGVCISMPFSLLGWLFVSWVTVMPS